MPVRSSSGRSCDATNMRTFRACMWRGLKRASLVEGQQIQQARCCPVRLSVRLMRCQVGDPNAS